MPLYYLCRIPCQTVCMFSSGRSRNVHITVGRDIILRSDRAWLVPEIIVHLLLWSRNKRTNTSYIILKHEFNPDEVNILELPQSLHSVAFVIRWLRNILYMQKCVIILSNCNFKCISDGFDQISEQTESSVSTSAEKAVSLEYCSACILVDLNHCLILSAAIDIIQKCTSVFQKLTKYVSWIM